MKTALIPPIPELPLFGVGDFHLLLSHLLSDDDYKKHYTRQRLRGSYLVLDNSAHEFKSGQDPEILIRQALEIGAQEVVIPDVLEKSMDTVESAVATIEFWFEKSPVTRNYDPALMYVPQGESPMDWIQSLKELILLHTYTARRYNLSRSFVIGVSKDYEMWDGGLEVLLREHVASYRRGAEEKGFKMSIHLLGWGRQLWKLRSLKEQFPWIRSTDSAKPFVYAIKDIWLANYMDSDPPEYPTRPEGYFYERLNMEQTHCAISNVKVYRSLAEGRDIL